MAAPNPFKTASSFTPARSPFAPAPQAAPAATNWGWGPPGPKNQRPLNVDQETPDARAKKPKLNGSHQVIIDPKGDLYLQVSQIKSETPDSADKDVNSGTTEFLVDSKALSRASPAFAKLVDGASAESKKPGEPTTEKKWVIKLLGDNDSAMSALLHIMHCRFDRGPATSGGISVEDLYQIAILTNKYDCAPIVRPWIKSWLGFTDRLYLGASLQELERVSWIAWEFGDRGLFERVAKNLVLRLTTSKKNDLFKSEIPSSTLFHDTLEPNGLKDLVHRRREMAINALLSPVHEVLGKMLQPANKPSRSSICREAERLFSPHPFSLESREKGQQLDCEAIMLGRLIQFLTAAELWPLPSFTTYQRSVMALGDSLKTLSIKGYPGNHHHLCNLLPDHSTSVDTVINGLDSVATDSQKRHLEAQAKKSGLSAGSIWK